MSDDSILPIKVIIEHKKSISETIPEDVTREKVSRWLDVISPVTAWCGLIGDQLEHKRSLLRLEREAALYELAEKLKPKLEGKVITPIPAKQLIPALENAGLDHDPSRRPDRRESDLRGRCGGRAAAGVNAASRAAKRCG
jgi:hypothetical protein